MPPDGALSPLRIVPLGPSEDVQTPVCAFPLPPIAVFSCSSEREEIETKRPFTHKCVCIITFQNMACTQLFGPKNAVLHATPAVDCNFRCIVLFSQTAGLGFMCFMVSESFDIDLNSNYTSWPVGAAPNLASIPLCLRSAEIVAHCRVGTIKNISKKTIITLCIFCIKLATLCQ